MKRGGREKLNLVMTYPVRWSLSHIMEDYIQNFYDVLGSEKFAREFVYHYDESRQELRLEGKKGFHVDWLQYIGASTKGDRRVRHTAGKFGKVFASMQERAQIRGVPLIFCNHGYEPDREDDRDRERFRYRDIEEAVAEIVFRLEGEALRRVFMDFSPYWRTAGKKTEGPDWRRLIQRIVRMISNDCKICQKVYGYLKDRYIADIDAYAVKRDKNKYRTAMEWFHMSEFHGRLKLLTYYFSALGIETIYSLCEKHDGFHVIYEPDALQQERIRILEMLAGNIFPDLLCYETLPKCRVIANERTPNEGFAMMERLAGAARNGMGLKVVSHITEINLRKRLFEKDAFPEAMTVYMHELLHQFGGDASRQFRAAIQAMNYRIMQNYAKLEEYECMWRKVEGQDLIDADYDIDECNGEIADMFGV